MCVCALILLLCECVCWNYKFEQEKRKREKTLTYNTQSICFECQVTVRFSLLGIGPTLRKYILCTSLATIRSATMFAPLKHTLLYVLHFINIYFQSSIFIFPVSHLRNCFFLYHIISFLFWQSVQRVDTDQRLADTVDTAGTQHIL